MTMKTRAERYPATILHDIRTTNTPTEGGLLGCGLLQCPVDTPFGEYSFIPSHLQFAYFGYLREKILINYAYFRVTTIGAGNFVGAQIGFFSGPPPTDQSFDLDCLKVVNMVNVFGTTGHKKYSCNQELNPDIHLYVGWWVKFDQQNPKFMPLGRDYGCGLVRQATSGDDDPFYPGGVIYVSTIAPDADQTGIDCILKYTSA